jgi:hypothetical protein
MGLGASGDVKISFHEKVLSETVVEYEATIPKAPLLKRVILSSCVILLPVFFLTSCLWVRNCRVFRVIYFDWVRQYPTFDQ